ncbi:MAG: hypothetical protein NVS2B9_05560 [Myxococcales bacterium]
MNESNHPTLKSIEGNPARPPDRSGFHSLASGTTAGGRYQQSPSVQVGGGAEVVTASVTDVERVVAPLVPEIVKG